MKTQVLSTSVSVLAGLMLLVLAFFSSQPIAHTLLMVVGLVWLVVVAALFVWKRVNKADHGFVRVIRANRRTSPVTDPEPEPSNTEPSAPVEIEPGEPYWAVLLRHASCRITDYLHSAFPDATWRWETKAPEQIIANGGTARIRLSSAGEYSHADVALNTDASIKINLMRVATLDELLNGVSQAAESQPAPAVNGTEAWYSLMGRQKLQEISIDLQTCGHRWMYLAENGDVLVTEDNSTAKQAQLANMPGRKFWKELIVLLSEDGVNVSEEKDMLKLTFGTVNG